MPIIRSKSDLNKMFDGVIQNALLQVREKIAEIIQKFIYRYYDEQVFTDINGNATNEPKQYERTNAFLNSLCKTDVVKTGNGFECRVYIDTDSMNNYDNHNGLEVMEMINRGFHADVAMNDGFYKTRYNIRGVKVWDESLAEIEKTKIIAETFREFLKSEGLSVG